MSIMNSSVKTGAALRLRRSAETPVFESASDANPAPHETSRENLYRFPSIGIPPRRPVAVPDEPSLARLDDLAAELEAALMSDLNKVTQFWGNEAPAIPSERPGQLRLPLAPAAPQAVLPASKDEVPHSDRLAVELLLARGRAAAPVPAPVAPRVEPRALEESLAGELADRLSAAVDELKIAEGEPVGPVPALSTPQPARRFAINRPLVAAAVATLLMAGGALLTVQSLTANPDLPAAADVSGEAAVSEPVAEAMPAVAAKQSYERAAEDEALPEAPQLRGADLMLAATLSPRAGSAGGTATVDPSVRAAYAMPDVAPAADVSPAVAAVTAEAGGDPLPDARGAGIAEPASAERAPAVATASADAGQAPAAAVTAATPAAAIADPQPGAARITGGVRLRGNPDNGAPTVGYLKPGAQVRIIECKGWCEVVAGDKRGFVFKRFLAAL